MGDSVVRRHPLPGEWRVVLAVLATAMVAVAGYGAWLAQAMAHRFWFAYAAAALALSAGPGIGISIARPPP